MPRALDVCKLCGNYYKVHLGGIYCKLGQSQQFVIHENCATLPCKNCGQKVDKHFGTLYHCSYNGSQGIWSVSQGVYESADDEWAPRTSGTAPRSDVRVGECFEYAYDDKRFPTIVVERVASILPSGYSLKKPSDLPHGWLFSGIINSESEVKFIPHYRTNIVIVDDKYPHICSRCNGRCYIGFSSIEHESGKDC